MNLSDTDLAILGRLRRIFADYFGMIDCPNLAALRETPPASPNSGSRPLRRFLINTRQPRFRLRVCQALDTEADAFVVDAELGSLALVHLVRLPQVDDPARSAEARENLRAWISGRIHEAAYLRHLLVECLRPGEPQHGAAPYFVEVVFVEAGEGLSSLLGEILQKSARELAILHAIGIGVLPFHPELVAPGPVAPDYRPSGALLPGLHRAFPWLLHLTASWMETRIRAAREAAEPGATTAVPPALVPGFRRFSRAPSVSPVDPVRPGPPSEIWLKHFRLRGTRRWNLEPRQLLHLVHGHNGSGKSSFVEALELVSVGKIDRLEGQDHRKIVTHRDMLTDRRFAENAALASVRLRFATRRATSRTSRDPAHVFRWNVGPRGVPSPLIPADGLRTGSFRLNLDFLDLLAQGSSAGRAQRLFETFFPEGIALFEDSRSLVPRRDEALKALPPRVQTLFRNPSGQYDESRAAAALEGIRKDGFAWERLPSLLPIDASRVGTLLPALLPQFESAYRRTGTATSWEPVLEAAREIDQGFRSLLARRSQLRADLVAARAFLDAYRDASAVSVTASKGELPELYHEFLQWQAASDLLRREHEVLATLEALPKSRPPNDASTFPAGSVPVLVEPGLRDPLPDPANRRARVEAALERLAEARRQVKDWRSGAPEAAAESVPAIPLSRFDLSALDRLADAGGFGREYVHVAPKLSDAVRRAFAEAHVVECLQASRVVIRVGDPGALRELADRASAFDAAFQGLEAARSEYEAPCDGLAGMLPPLRELRDLADLDQSRQDEAVERFFERLRTPLGAALNEFTAMLTPARWAYADVVNRVETTDARPALGFVQGEAPTDTVPAPLRLNTAQLSAFALAFFLLCHRAREHPLRLGILDDPFENMDELTVTTVARGLGRYLRLRSRLGDGPDSWQLLLFLHGEQNVNRVRREVPCATYLLPWLAPGARLGKGPPLETESTGSCGATLQDLAQILDDGSPATRATAAPAR